MAESVISIAGLGKTYGSVRALEDVWLEIPAGSVLGLLGHNGAGKTTLIGILSTLVTPGSGNARVAGFDVVTQGQEVRRRIGLTGQYAAVDEQISGCDNLVLIARLLGFSRERAMMVATELLEAFDLAEAGSRSVRAYSGGMRRRLDLAAGLIGDPQVLFLDEPTTGLDPESRLRMWDMVERRVADGATVLLTTQYLQEADRLADHLAVLDSGRIVFSGQAAELKARYGRRVALIRLHDRAAAGRALSLLRAAGLGAELTPPRTSAAPATATISATTGTISPTHLATSVIVPITGPGELLRTLRLLDDHQCAVADTLVNEPTLDDVYVTLRRETLLRSA